MTFTYPERPAGADKNITRPSKQFKKSTYKVILAILVFVLTYIFLLISAIAIALAMGWLGVALISTVSNFLVLILGGGLILSGLMLIFFLVKFIFNKSPKRVKGYEIMEDEQSQLFAFVRKVTAEVGTSNPKHIYLIPEVNASASFQPTIWSLFLPIRKNLSIGLGIVNGLNQSEFKAVLAHEFGHFSQRSMRFGGYVYHLNKALYNLLYENEGYHKALNAWGRLHYVLRFSAMLNVYIVRGIQAILRKVYVLINKSHMQLSREMEFHADTIAAYVSGSNNVTSLLRRLEVADQCYNDTLDLLNENLAQKKRTANAYELQSLMLRLYAADNKLSVDKNGLPVIEKQIAALKNSQVTIDNQWSSHPSMEDREENVNKYKLNAVVIDEPAWQLFNDAEKLQEIFTDKMYENVQKKEELTIVSNQAIKEFLENEIAANSYDKRYKGFYNGRLIKTFDLQETLSGSEHSSQPVFDELFTDENCNLPKLVEALNADINKLESLIEVKTNDITSFDFKGVKHYPKDAAVIKELLSAELKEKEESLDALDKKVFVMFYRAASTDELKRKLIGQYENVFKYQADAVADYDNYNDMMGSMRPAYTRMQYSDIYDVVNNIYRLEKKGKLRIKSIVESPDTRSFINDEEMGVLNKYLDNNWVYFNEPRYDNNAINVFNAALNTYVQIVTKRNFHFKKALFDFQLTLIA